MYYNFQCHLNTKQGTFLAASSNDFPCSLAVVCVRLLM